MSIKWINGAPYSTQFDDIYFSTDDGLAETDYVFIRGNQLESRWQTLQENQTFTIIETGFGTGLNFLCVCKKWLSNAPASAKLNFISTEKYPLSPNELTTALLAWPDLADIAAHLLASYATLLETNQTILLFNESVSLTLHIGDAASSLQNEQKLADAWFLDGFAPSKNPEMWSEALFNQMARLSHMTTTFATFTSAGIVRRGLMQAGFSVQKITGYGKKREMLTGTFKPK